MSRPDLLASSEERVVLDNPRTMNLLGLLMQGLLEGNLKSVARQRILRRLRGDVQVRAGKMTATLRFADGRITILAGRSPKPKAWVKGTMTGMLGLITATDPIRPLVTRTVTFGGNPLWLAAVVPLVISDQAVKDALFDFLPTALRPN